jgi:hypothetical protein
VRDLPLALPKTQLGDRELPPVKPNHPVPTGFADPVAQIVAAALAMPAPMANFEGQSANDSGCGCIPPDPNGAVGPTQYVQMVNSSFSVYDKAGTRLSGPTQINALFQTLPATSRCFIDNSGDPVVVYDQLADRWVLSQFAVGGGNGPTSSECVAVSKSGDATGQYFIYDFDLTNSNGKLFEDYPHFGLWPDAYYMSTHEFTFLNATPSGAYQGAAAWALERAQMLAGQPARLVYFRLGAGDPTATQMAFGGQLPSNLDGFTLPPAGSPNYFVEVDTAADNNPDAPGSLLRIWKFHVDWSNPLNSTFGDSLNNPNTRTTVADFARPNCMNDAAGCVPQLGDSFQLDPIGDRLMFRNAYRNFGNHESLVLNHTVVSNATTGQMGPRWYEVRNPGGTPTIFQQSTFVPTSQTDLLYRWMSSVAMDSAGDMAIGYSTSSQINFPSIAYAGRLAGDTPSTLGQGETQLFAGGGPQHGQLFAPQFGRWGDYTAMQIDPADDCTFWYTDEYYAAADAPIGIWHTRVGSFKFPSCTPRPTGILLGTVTDSATTNPIAGASVTAGGYTALTNGTGFYQFSPLAPGTYTATASATGYFSSSPTTVTLTNGGVTTQNFALTRNPAQPTPTPAPPTVLETVNPPVLVGPSGTTTNTSYTVTWNPAEVTTNLDHYIVEESTDYVEPLFDNADGTVTPPATVGPLWTTTSSPPPAAAPNPWTQSPTFSHSMPFSYFGNGATNEAIGSADTNLTLNNNITIPTTVGSGRLTFWSRYFNDPDDTGNVEISTDGGAHWVSLKILNISPPFPPGTPPADTRMQNYELDLSAYRGTPFKLQFRYNNGAFIFFFIRSVGWWVDDINADGATWTQIGTTGPSTTSFNITNKPNGQYYYRVRGVYTNGNFTTHSNVQNIIVNTPLTLTSVVSMKTHSTAGAFGVNLPLPPVASPRGVECRSPGQLPGGAADDYQLVFTFGRPLQSVASATVVSHNPPAPASTGTVDAANSGIGPKPNQYTVNLANVSNAQYITVSLSNVVDAAGNSGNILSPQMGVLIGDVNATGGVDGNDVAAVQSQTRQPVNSDAEARFDVNATGAIDGNDVAITQGHTRTSLPSAP